MNFDCAPGLKAERTGTLPSKARFGRIGGAALSANSTDALLPTTVMGVRNAGCTWNQWPRFNSQVPEFAPDNAMAAVVVDPEAHTWG